MTHLPHPKPRLKLFHDPSAEVVWAGICALDEASQHDVLDELRRRLAISELRDGPADSRRAEAVRGLREAAALNGGSPSWRTYVRLQVEHPDADLPHPGTVKKWLGARTWNEALAEAHLESVPDGEVLVVERGSEFTADEAAAAVKEAADELGDVPTLTAYLAWARKPSTRARAGRRPSSQGVFDRLFPGQGFKGALVLAGLANADSATGIVAGKVGRGYAYTDEEMANALMEVARRIGSLPRGPRVAEFNQTRALILAEEQAAGKPQRAFPTYQAIHRRYPGSWDEALVAAGLQPLGGVATATRREVAPRERRRFDDDQVLADLLEGYDAIGDDFGYHDYEAWRRQLVADHFAAGKPRRIVSAQTARSRYGTWPDVQATVRAAAKER